VNGIRAYKMAEIQQALQEWGTECSLGNGKLNAGIYYFYVHTVIIE